MDGILLVVIVVVLVAAFTWVALWIQSENTKRRRQELLEKYGDESVVERIMNRIIWQGMSQEQLIDSWGRPVAKDQKVYKTKIAETFKYNQTGKNQFKDRVLLENGFVVGWKQR